MGLLTLVSSVLLALVAVPLAYLWMLALASAFPQTSGHGKRPPCHRFAVTIPAHNEESVITDTVSRLRQLDYPAELFQVHVVADHCSDRTAELARDAGAVVHERNEGPRSGKGAALSWLFGRVLTDPELDAVVVFDGDTRVASDFLRVMDGRLTRGDKVIQGQHVISNSATGWFPALTWAMFLIDNRFSNRGRANLGLSAKNMGDSICLRADVLRSIGWGEGLTEDYQLRQRLLLDGVRIAYEPTAIGEGEGVASWGQARAQRARWLRGTMDASHQFARVLLKTGLQRRDPALVDGALQAHFPSYSSLSFLTASLLAAQIVAVRFGATIDRAVLRLWFGALVSLFVYPLYGLALERAPLRAYMVILTGPFFIVWRSWLAMKSRSRRSEVVWIRTAHGESATSSASHKV